MDLLEISQKERIGRETAATRLHELADALARHNDVEFERDVDALGDDEPPRTSSRRAHPPILGARALARRHRRAR